jgi:hypothetical protein
MWRNLGQRDKPQIEIEIEIEIQTEIAAEMTIVVF